LGFCLKSTKTRRKAWRLFKMLQNVQNLMNIERLGSIPQKYTQNIRRLEFSDLPQTKRWKHRSCFENHVFKVRFEIGGFNLLGSWVLYQNPRRERERERQREKYEENELKPLLINLIQAYPDIKRAYTDTRVRICRSKLCVSLVRTRVRFVRTSVSLELTDYHLC
jgi:hypothetical protein